MARQSIFKTIKDVKGNQRTCLYLEPLWGIPYNLYLPFVSVYMAALGMNALQIGMVTSVFFMSQMVWALLSGAITDKLGRRKATIIFDLLSWSVPALLWMGAQNFTWFLVAALFNGAWRVTETSWGLLLVEDAPEDWLVNMFSISHIAGLVAGFVAPLAYFFVKEYSVVPTMRVLYFITFVMMSAKFIILYFNTKETKMGLRRMQETKHQSVFKIVLESRFVLQKMVKNRTTILTVLLIACFGGMKSVNDIFWPLLVTTKLQIPVENLSVFSTIKSLLMLLSYFVIVPHLSVRHFKIPLVFAFFLMFLDQLLMVFMPQNMYFLVVLSAILEATALSMLNPLISSLQMLNVDKVERARMLGLFYAMTMLVTAPLGTIGGLLTKLNPILPFVMNIVLILLAIWTAFGVWRACNGKVIKDSPACP